MLPSAVSGCVTYHIGRCGSTVLGHMLNQNPALRSDGEIYTVAFKKARETEPDISPKKFTQRHVARRNDNAVARRGYLVECKFFSSLDMALYDGRLDLFVAFMRSLGFDRGIVLVRRNLLRRLVSTAIAKKRGAYQKRTADEQVVPKVTIDPNAVWLGRAYPLAELIDLIEAEYAELRATLARQGVASLDLVYEDDVEADPAVAYRRVCGFYNIAETPAAPAFFRINGAPLSEVVENFTVVSAALAGTRHEWMLAG